ncbi:MAG: hypothetical protein AB7S36_19460, partial [Planctomycetota bacterium]
SHRGVTGPHNADRIADTGRTLVCNSRENRVEEIDATGRIVWQCADGLAWPRDADRLPNGHTLIADTGHARIIEVNAHGEIVWQYRNAPMVYDADRLPNGHTRFSTTSAIDGGRIVEVDADCRVVWTWLAPASAGEVDGFARTFDLRPASLRSRLLAAGRAALAAGAPADAINAAAAISDLRAATREMLRLAQHGHTATVSGTCNVPGARITWPGGLVETSVSDAGTWSLDGMPASGDWVTVVAPELPASEWFVKPGGEPAVFTIPDRRAIAFPGPGLVISAGSPTDQPVAIRLLEPAGLRQRRSQHRTRSTSLDDARACLANLAARGQLREPGTPTDGGEVIALGAATIEVSLCMLRAATTLRFHVDSAGPVSLWTNRPGWAMRRTPDEHGVGVEVDAAAR